MRRKMIEKNIFILLEKLLNRYSTESVLDWVSHQIMISSKQTKFAFAECISGISIKRFNLYKRDINKMSKFVVAGLFKLLFGIQLIKTGRLVFKAKRLPEQNKREIMATTMLKYKKMIYRGDGFSSQLIEVADSLYMPLDERISDILGYSYSDVRDLFILLYQTRYLKKGENENFYYIDELVGSIDSGKLDNILRDFAVKESCNYEYTGLTEKNIINEKPIIIINDKLYIPILSQLIHNIPKFFHYILLKIDVRFNESEQAKNLKNDYSQIRGFSLEKLLYDVGNSIIRLPSEKIFHDLKYKGGEADITIQNSNTTILLEVKGKLLTLSTFKGDISAFNNDFKLAINDAYKQAYRTEKYIKLGGKFYYKKNKKKKFSLLKTPEYIKVCVTVENFGVTAIELNNYVSLEKGDSNIPLSLNIYDLLFIIRNVESLDELIEYFRYRIKYYDYIISVDELEIFGAFKNQLVFDVKSNSISFITNQISELEKIMEVIEHRKLMNYEIKK